MKIKTGIDTNQRLEFNMTPMIDCVFQLLIFFLLTLRYAAPEGDFNIKMPLVAPSAARPDTSQLPPIKIRLLAAGDGKLAGIQMGDRKLAGFQDLHAQVLAIVGEDRGPASAAANTEVELDFDYRLKFEYVISAISAVSGYLANDGQTIVKLVEKIKFAPPRPE